MGRGWRGAAQSRSLIRMENKGYYMYMYMQPLRVDLHIAQLHCRLQT